MPNPIKVGDIVTLKPYQSSFDNQWPNLDYDGEMKKLFGTKGVIEEIGYNKVADCKFFIMKGAGWTWNTEWAEQKKILPDNLFKIGF